MQTSWKSRHISMWSVEMGKVRTYVIKLSNSKLTINKSPVLNLVADTAVMRIKNKDLFRGMCCWCTLPRLKCDAWCCRFSLQIKEEKMNILWSKPDSRHSVRTGVNYFFLLIVKGTVDNFPYWSEEMGLPLLPLWDVKTLLS